MRGLQRHIAIWTRLVSKKDTLRMDATNVIIRSRSTSPPHKKPRLLEAEGDKLLHTEPLIAVESSHDGALSSPKKVKKGKKNKRPPPPEPCSPEDVNLRDVYNILGSEAVERALASGAEYTAPIALQTEIELKIADITSHGKGDQGEAVAILPALQYSPWAVLVPFALPEEVVIAKIYRHSKMHSYADLVRVITPNTTLRDNSLIKCKYFGICGGCQYQMLPYETQLQFKQRVVEKAYRTYSGLPESSLPSVLPTIPSPKQYAYRTKITPHFDAPPKAVQKALGDAAGDRKTKWEARIGFDQKGRRTVLDIEECPIATAVVNKGLKLQREKIKAEILNYKRGSTLLLRDSYEADPAPSPLAGSDETIGFIDDDIQRHICVVSHKTTVRERVAGSDAEATLFDFPAGSFFQNNNSILGPLTTYVQNAIFGHESASQDDAHTRRTGAPTHLVDTYCGSGLFSITLSKRFKYVAGIEIDANAISCARHNLSLNNLDIKYEDGKKKHTFHAGKSEDIFASVLSASAEPFPANDTVVIIDPPRKGCDVNFINQLTTFGPSLLVYVSCNVHTQARDVGMIIQMMKQRTGGSDSYIIESLRGFDLFPQTAHVESVAVLRRQSTSQIDA